jgi:hypothetical protein
MPDVRERVIPSRSTYHGVSIPASQFRMVTRSPKDLANAVYTNTLGINDRRSPEDRVTDRDEMKETAARAAGHALNSQLVHLETLATAYSARREDLLGIMRELKAPFWAHYKLSNLDKMRRTADIAIHQSIETASINMNDWDTYEVDGLHRAIRFHMYGHDGHNNARMHYYRKYVLMAGRHTRNIINAIEESKKATDRERQIYLPALKAKHGENV